MRKTRFAIAIVGMFVAALPAASPISAADTTTVTVNPADVGATSIGVTGLINFGDDATATRVVGTDAAGDAVVKGAGLDLGNLTVRPDIAAKRLIWTLAITDGLAAPFDGSAPASGISVPLMVNGDDKWRWLAAGTPGSNNGKTTNWTGVCHNESADGTEGGWNCPTTTTGSFTAAGVTWTQRFQDMKPPITYGAVLEPSTIYCGLPCSFSWPAGAVTALTPYDVLDIMDSYKVPGQVELAIAPTGTTPKDTAFTNPATFNGTTKVFSGAVPRPAAPGAYTVWARTCFGDGWEPTCVLGSTSVTI
jgi:hypothetical protein